MNVGTGSEMSTQAKAFILFQGSRDAVESAIDAAKARKDCTWEGYAAKTGRRFMHWTDAECATPAPAEKSEAPLMRLVRKK